MVSNKAFWNDNRKSYYIYITDLFIQENYYGGLNGNSPYRACI